VTLPEGCRLEPIEYTPPGADAAFRLRYT